MRRPGVLGQAESLLGVVSSASAGPFDKLTGLESPFTFEVAEVSRRLPRKRHFAQAQHTKHQRCLQNEKELEKTCIVAESGEDLLLPQKELEFHFQKGTMGVKGLLTVLGTAEIEIFVFLLIFYFS